ncbi:MAG: SAM-dependent methyltransferase [Flavobacteriales bacterium]|nr:SAM-dependent methyltransferase [Flavobacteriales bacterium]
MSQKGKLILIPNFLGESNTEFISTYNLKLIHQLDEFIVENEKPARAFLKEIQSPVKQDDFIFHFMGKHSDRADFGMYLNSCFEGKTIGLLSDAGLPCVADPGFEVVKIAQKNDIEVVPLMGFSSIMMALMASGFNGQSFRFHGYLPHDIIRKRKIIKQALADISRNETQIFIETPYRNASFIAELKQQLPEQTMLCVAVDISLPTQEIKTKQLRNWSNKEEHLHKRPAVFLLGL